ncbi:MAG TPA: hypothetical protein VL832_03715 [Puia sp.]|nr:hypothetical protein [Puia sp.]
MKKTILPIVLCIAIGSTQVHAANRYLTNEGTPSKKSAPVVRNILSDKLPAKLLTTIKKSYKDYWITALYKEVANGKTSYHITVENADKVVTLSATHSTNWSVSRITPKDQPAS